MLVAGVGGVQLTAFVANPVVDYTAAWDALRDGLTKDFGGFTELSGQGYWTPPKGITIVDSAIVLVVVSTDIHALPKFMARLREWQEAVGEQQILVTRNNVDVIYLNKEQA